MLIATVESVIILYISGSYKVTENWSDFHDKIKIIKQILVNNNFFNINIDQHINKLLARKHSNGE